MKKLVDEAQKLIEINDSFGASNVANNEKKSAAEKKKKQETGKKGNLKDKLGSLMTSGKEDLDPHQIAGVTDLEIPPTDVKTNEWYQWFCEIQIKLQKVQEENKKIEGDILRRHDRYVMRE